MRSPSPTRPCKPRKSRELCTPITRVKLRKERRRSLSTPFRTLLALQPPRATVNSDSQLQFARTMSISCATFWTSSADALSTLTFWKGRVLTATMCIIWSGTRAVKFIWSRFMEVMVIVEPPHQDTSVLKMNRSSVLLPAPTLNSASTLYLRITMRISAWWKLCSELATASQFRGRTQVIEIHHSWATLDRTTTWQGSNIFNPQLQTV